MAVVFLDICRFRELYPELPETTPDVKIEFWFSQAQTIINNSDCGIIKDLKEREMMLFLLMRHFAALEERTSQGGLVGRISSATEGSVSVSADMGGVSGNAAWFMQTPWGANYWQMTAKYRGFRYIPGGCYARRR